MSEIVHIFYSRDDLDDGAERAKNLAKNLEAKGAKVRLVHKLGYEKEDLHLVAKHKVVTTPSLVVVEGDKVVFRKTGLATARDVMELLEWRKTRKRKAKA